MSEPALDTSSVSYATVPPPDLDARFDTDTERQKPCQVGPVHSAAAAVTGAAMVMAVTGGGIALATATPDWSATGEFAVSGWTEERAALSSRLNAYRHLPENWDGAEGRAPPGKAVDEGLAFIDLLPLGIPVPTPFVAGDGEVGFHWKTVDSFAEVSFYGDGHIYFYAKIGDEGADIEGVEPYTGRSIPKRLAQALAEI